MAAADRSDECSILCGVLSKAGNTHDYSSWTSVALHGFGQVKKAQSQRQRVLWALIVAFGTILSVIQTKNTFSAYLQNVSATRVSIQEKPRIRFPTIYVCPKSPDALNQTLVLEDMRQHLGPYWARMDEQDIHQIAAYAIAGAGIRDMENVLKKFTVASRMRLNRLFRKWLGGRSYEAFYRALFETYGYRCDEMFYNCSHAYKQINCCDIFEQSYVMLRGRCFRLKKFYQTYPDRYGQLSLEMKQLPSWFVEKDGKQSQALLYLTEPGAEAATFPRYYFNPSSFNQLIITKRHIKMLESNPHCAKRTCKRCGAVCYIKRWLNYRVVKPLNCTLYYIQHHAPGYKVCSPWEIVTRYVDVIDESTNGSTKCLPPCDREDYYFHRVTVTDREMNGKFANLVNKFRVDMHYADLEVETFEEVVTTTVPGFVAELGGQSNLFLGLSIISVLQAVRILGLKIYVVLRCLQRMVCPCLVRSIK